MIVYQSTKEGFTSDVETGVVEDDISVKYETKLHRRAPESEKRAWRNSLNRMYTVLNDEEIPADSGVSVEMQIPQTSKRIDLDRNHR